MKITLPFHQFPDGLEAQHRFISDYFSGKDYKLNVREEHVDIVLSSPQDLQYYIDPNIRTGLDWWEPGLDVKDIPFSVRQMPGYQLSLNDNWTLLAWAKWFEQRKLQGLEGKRVIILHIDDHRDCMAPLLFLQEGNGFLDPLTRKKVDMAIPKSIQSAIQSGAVAVGSFMPIFFHSVPNIEFRHLLPPHRLSAAFQSGNIKIDFETDTLLCKTCERPGLEFEYGASTGYTYHPTSDLNDFLTYISADASVLLHVDMDYFNNRFDGDSDWEQHDYIHDPDKNDLLAQVADVFRAITEKVPKVQLEDITVALSPGFFPAEFWKDSLQIVDQYINERNES